MKPFCDDIRRRTFAWFITAMVITACGRHVTQVTDEMNAPVNGDTISYYPTMNAQLREDSIRQDDAYYYRINYVKRVEITDSSSREIKEIDRFGHQLTEKVWVAGDLFWVDEDQYNRYGHLVKDKHSFYPDEELSLLFTGEYFYVLDSSSQSEYKTKIISTCRDYDDNTTTITEWVYEYKNGQVATETEYENSKCVCRFYYTYNEAGKLAQERALYFKADQPDSTLKIYRYDSLHREIGWALLEDGVLVEDGVTEWNADNRISKYTNIEYKDYRVISFEYDYLPNGLVNTCTTSHLGTRETQYYRYWYYGSE